MTVFVILMIVWNMINTFFAFTAFLASYRNDTEIEAIKQIMVSVLRNYEKRR